MCIAFLLLSKLCSATDPVAGAKRMLIAVTPFEVPGSPLKTKVLKSVRTTLSELKDDKKGGAQNIEVLLRGMKPTSTYTTSKGAEGTH